MPANRYRVALSFDGAKRSYVGEVARLLAGIFGEEAILYDEFHLAEIARHNGGIYLSELYSEQSDLVVPVLTSNYTTKLWTDQEWTHIYSLLTKADGHRVLLSRFENATADGLTKTAIFIELDHKSPEEFATLILERLASNERLPKDYYTKLAASVWRSYSTAIPNNLPNLQPFFGREAELRQVADAIRPGSPGWGALIDGAGGMGKTSLAIRAAYDAPPKDFDRIVFVSLKTRDLDDDGMHDRSGFVLSGLMELFNELARELGEPDITKAPEDDRPNLLRNSLRKAKTLLILDNLESLVTKDRGAVLTFVKRLPAGCKAILTSREPLGNRMQELTLEKLDQEAALAMLEELAVHVPPLAQTSAKERIALYRETAGNPLLLCWTAAQLGRRSVLTVNDALNLLRSCTGKDDPLEFVFGNLLEDLSSTELNSFSALTHFTLPARVEHVAAVIGLPESEVNPALLSLTTRSIAVYSNELKTFTLVPMVAAFLRKKKLHLVEEAGRRLMHRAYQEVITNGLHKHARFQELEEWWPMIVAALPLFVAGDNAQLQKVCDALRQFCRFMGYWDDWLSLSIKAEQKALDSHDFREAGWRAFQAGQVSRLRRNADAVLAAADRADRHWDRYGKPLLRERGCAEAMRGRGFYIKGSYHTAIDHFTRALCTFEQVPPDESGGAVSFNIASCLNGLADAQRHLASDHKTPEVLVQAESNYRRAQQLAKEIHSPETEAAATSSLAQMVLDKGAFKEAEPLALEAMPLAEHIHCKELIARNCRRLAQARLHQGRAGEALPHARRAVEIYTQLGSPDLAAAQKVLDECEAAEEQRFAEALLHQGRAGEALQHARRAVEIYRQLGSPELDAAQKLLDECEAAS